MYSTHASVVMVKPEGTRSAPSTRVISATLAPLPPSSSRMSREPSEKSYTHCSAAIGRKLSRADGAQAQVGVVLQGVEDRPLGLGQRARARLGRVGERR